MDCDKAGMFMMKFMDKALPDRDMKLLREHLGSCGTCSEDFLVYNDIMSSFSEIELIPAPDDLEAKVMERIDALAVAKEKAVNTLDNIAYWCFGIFSVLIGVNFVFSLNKDRIIEYLYQTPNLGVLADFILALSDYASRFSANLSQLTSGLLVSFSDYFSYARYVLIGVLVVLGIIQYILYRRDKVEA